MVSLICLALATPLMELVRVGRDVTLVRSCLVALWLIAGMMWLTTVRRMHDGDSAVGWAAVVMGGPTIVLLGATAEATGIHLPRWAFLLGLLAAGLLTWAGSLLMFASHKSGPNRFGPDPEMPPPRTAAAQRLQDAAEGPTRPAAWPIVDPRGRTSRLAFAAILTTCVILGAPIVAMTHLSGASSPFAIGLGASGFALAIALLLVGSVRRSHDIDGGAKFGLLVGLGPVFCAPALFIDSLAIVPAAAAGGLLSIGLLLEAAIDGVRGPNRYGPDPLKRSPPKRRAAHGEEFLKIRRKMRRLALPTLLLTDNDAPGFSKLGGDPELPAALAWPSRERGPLSFLAQVDLAQAHEHGGPDWLPQMGGLYLFAEADGGGGDGRAAVVLHAPDISTIEPTPPPPGLPKFAGRFGERRVALAAFTSLPSLDALGIDVREIDVEDDELDELSDLPTQAFKADRLHRLAGYPNEIQESRLALECELGSRGLDTGGVFDAEADPKLLRASKSWRLLLQIDSDPELGMMWGDTGMLYVFVREADARAGDFSKTWLISQCH